MAVSKTKLRPASDMKKAATATEPQMMTMYTVAVLPDSVG